MPPPPPRTPSWPSRGRPRRARAARQRRALRVHAARFRRERAVQVAQQGLLLLERLLLVGALDLRQLRVLLHPLQAAPAAAQRRGRPFRSATTRSIQRSACLGVAAGAAASPRASAAAADSQPPSGGGGSNEGCNEGWGVFFAQPAPPASPRFAAARGSSRPEGARAVSSRGSASRVCSTCSFAQPCCRAPPRLRAPSRERRVDAARLAPAGAGVPRARHASPPPPPPPPVPWPCAPGRALPLREREVRAERRPRGRGEEQRQAGEAAGSVRGATAPVCASPAWRVRQPPRARGSARGRAAAEGDESAASAIAFTPVSAGGTGAYAWCLCAGARRGLAALPPRARRDVLLDVHLAVARLLRPNGGLDAHALRWGGLWKRSTGPSPCASGDRLRVRPREAVAAGVAMADDVLRPTGLRGSRRTDRQRSGSRGARLDSSRRRVERARVAAIHRGRRYDAAEGRWTCVRRVGARAARRVTVRSCVAVWSCPRISNCQGVFLNLFIPSFSRLSTVGRRRLRRPLGGRRLVRLRTGTRFPVTSRRAATAACAVGTADAALGASVAPRRGPRLKRARGNNAIPPSSRASLGAHDDMPPSSRGAADADGSTTPWRS